MDLSQKELTVLIFLVRLRLQQEARRPARFSQKGEDLQSYQVRKYSDLLEHLEELKLEE